MVIRASGAPPALSTGPQPESSAGQPNASVPATCRDAVRVRRIGLHHLRRKDRQRETDRDDQDDESEQHAPKHDHNIASPEPALPGAALRNAPAALIRPADAALRAQAQPWRTL